METITVIAEPEVSELPILEIVNCILLPLS